MAPLRLQIGAPSRRVVVQAPSRSAGAAMRGPGATSSARGHPRAVQRRVGRRDGRGSVRAATTGDVQTSEQLVSQVLEMIKGTDRGADVEVTKRAAIDNILEELELRGQQQMPRPLDNNPLLWGNYEVAYTSAGPAQNGAPAGGRFRGPLGRLLFRTRGLYQSVFEPSDPSDPPTAVNKVEFSLLGFLPGWAGLRGKVEPEGAGNMDTVKVTFAPARVNLFGLEMVLGKPSSVVLQTVYLDERVRLGRGSRGSLFVFRRGGAAESAGMETLGTGAGVPGRMVLGAITLALLCAGLALVVGVPPGSSGWAGKVAGAALLAVTGLCGAVLRRGGQENDPDAGSALNQEEMEMAEQMAAVADAGAEARAG